MCSSFFSVDFIAPVMPELQRDPNPMAETSSIAMIFHFKLGSSCPALSSPSLASLTSLEESFTPGTLLNATGTSFSVLEIPLDSRSDDRTGEEESPMFEMLQER